MFTRLVFAANPVRPLISSLLLASAFLVATGVGSKPVQAQLDYEQPEQVGPSGPKTEADLVAETQTIRPGQPFTVALHLSLEKDWHIYWRNPGDSGAPTNIKWSLPAGFKAGAIQWPTPHRFVLDSLVAYGYENEVWLLTQITPPATLPVGKPVTLAADANWLICSQQCIPQKQTLTLNLNVTSDAPTPDESVKTRFATARAALPVPASTTGFSIRADQPAASLAKPEKAAINLHFAPSPKLALSPTQLHQLYFYPADESTLSHPITQRIIKEGNGYRLPLLTSEYASEPLKRLRGVLIAPSPTTNALSRGIWIDVPVTSTLPTPRK